MVSCPWYKNLVLVLCIEMGKNKVESVMEMETRLVYVVGFKLSTRLYVVGRKNFGHNLRR